MLQRVLGPLINLYPVWILAGSALAMLHPPAFAWFSGEWITYALAAVMLGMGLTLHPADFRRVLEKPSWVVLGAALQFTVMPLLGWALAMAFSLPTPLAVGLILLGCCPGGTASNVVAYLARVDVALSVTMTAVSTMLAVVMTPLLSTWLIGDRVEVNAYDLFVGTVKVVLVPIVLGVILNRHCARLTRAVLPAAPLVAIVGILLIVGSIIGRSRDVILESGLPLLGAVTCLHAGGHLLGYVLAITLTRNGVVARTTSIEVGMQNGGLGAYLARANFADPATAVPAALGSSVLNIVASVLVAIFRRWPAAGPGKPR